MVARLTVFGHSIEKGHTAHVYFDKNGQVQSSSTDAAAHVEFEIDEDNDPVGHVKTGAEHFDHPLVYFGGFGAERFARASITAFNGRLIICARCEQEGSANHFTIWAATMKLWLLNVIDSVGDGALISLVVRAEDEVRARQLAAEKSTEDRGHDYRHDATTENYLGVDCWLDADRTSIQEIPLGAEGVIHYARC